MKILGFEIKRTKQTKQEEWKRPERKVVCDGCGFVEMTTRSSGGVDSIGNMYGHHFCLDGYMGTFRSSK